MNGDEGGRGVSCGLACPHFFYARLFISIFVTALSPPQDSPTAVCLVIRVVTCHEQ